jgi:hypothetical protein
MHPTGGSHSHNHCLLVFLLLTVATLLLAACRPSPALEHPQMNGFLEPYGADGENWPPNVEVTIQVYDQPQGKVLFAGTSKTSEDGHFFQGLALTTLPGMMVAVAHGSERQSVVLVPLAIEDINRNRRRQSVCVCR